MSENNFITDLFTHYPDLFYDKDGKKEIPCWSGVPKGWEGIVAHTLGCINEYRTCCWTSKPKAGKEFNIWIDRKIVDPIIRKIANKLDPIKALFRKRKCNGISTVDPEYLELKKGKRQKFIDAMYKWHRECPYFSYKNNYDKVAVCPPVKIDQIKEKFGTLRLYISGGNEEVRGIIQFAEFLSARTCQNTGAAGQMRNLNGWYVVLSDEEYEKVKIEKREL